MANHEQDAAETSSGTVKVILVSGLVVIAVLFVSKYLDLVPGEIRTGAVSVTFKGVASETGELPSADTAEFEKRIREFQDRLASSAPPPKVVPATATNIAGLWRAPLYNVFFTQVGNQLGMQVNQLGIVSAVGQGVLMGDALHMDYLNITMMPGRMTGTVAADGSRIDLIDYGRGFPEPVILTR